MAPEKAWQAAHDLGLRDRQEDIVRRRRIAYLLGLWSGIRSPPGLLFGRLGGAVAPEKENRCKYPEARERQAEFR